MKRLRVMLVGGALVVASALGIVADRATDPCYLVQRLHTDGSVSLERVCGEVTEATETEIEPDVIVVGSAGTRGLASTEGVLGATAADVDPQWLPGGRVGTAFRCALDPDRPGFLNAASNEECCCPDPKTPACTTVVYACP